MIEKVMDSLQWLYNLSEIEKRVIQSWDTNTDARSFREFSNWMEQIFIPNLLSAEEQSHVKENLVEIWVRIAYHFDCFMKTPRKCRTYP